MTDKNLNSKGGTPCGGEASQVRRIYLSADLILPDYANHKMPSDL
jgi:hypothetical protein